MSSVTNSGRTCRLYLNSLDATHPQYEERDVLGGGTNGIFDKDLIYDNQAVSHFDLGSASLLKKPNERIGLSLIKANFNGDIGLYNGENTDWSNIQDFPYEFGILQNDIPIQAGLGDELRLCWTTGTATSDVVVDNHMFIALPATMRRSMTNLVDIVNFFLAYRSTTPALWKISAHTRILYQDYADPTLTTMLDNRYFNDPTFKYYKRAHKAAYRDLGINTNTNIVYTNLNIGSLKTKISIKKLPGAPKTSNISTIGDYFLTTEEMPVGSSSQFLFVDAGGTTLVLNSSQFPLYRMDKVTETGAKTFLMYYKDTVGWEVSILPLQDPFFDFTGFTVQDPYYITGGTATFGNIKVPVDDVQYGTVVRRSVNVYGQNRNPGQIFSISANPSPIFVKMNKTTDSFATMANGTRDILAMCPVLPENQSLSFYLDDGSALAPGPSEERWAIDTMSGQGRWVMPNGDVVTQSPNDSISGFTSNNAGSDPDAVGYIGDTGTFTTGMFAWDMGTSQVLTCYSNSSGLWAAQPGDDLLLILGGDPQLIAATNWTPGTPGTLIRGNGTPSQSNGTWEVSPTSNAFTGTVSGSTGFNFSFNVGVPTGAGGTGANTPNQCCYDPSNNGRYWHASGLPGNDPIQKPASGVYEIVAGSTPNIGNLLMKPSYQTQGGTGPGGFALWGIDEDDQTTIKLLDSIGTLNPRIPISGYFGAYYTSNRYVGTWIDSTAVAGTAVANPTNYQFAKLDGADDYIEIDGLSDDVLSWTKSWSIGLHMKVIDNPIEGVKRCLFRRGNNAIYLSKGGGNYGLYVTAMDGEYDPSNYPGLPHSHGANTWFVPDDDKKWLFTYNNVSGKLMWYYDGIRKANIQLTSEEMTKGVVPNPPDYVDLPTPIDAVCINPLNKDEIMFFKDTKYYTYNLTTKAKVSETDITSKFVGTTTQVKNVVRNNRDSSTGLYGQLLIYETNGYMTRYNVNSVNSSGEYETFLNNTFWRNLESWKDHDAATLEHYTGTGRLVFKDDQFWESHNANGNFTGWVQYGGSGQYFQGLPHYLDGCCTDEVAGKVYAFKDNIQYEITNNKTTNPHTFNVVATKTIGGSMPSAPPLKVGEANGFVPYGGAFWDGQVSDLLIMNTNLVYQSQQITDYFADDDYSTHEYYNTVTNYFPLGEDVYPVVADDVGSASGEHKNGTAADFVVGDPLPANHPMLLRNGNPNDPPTTADDLVIKNLMLQGATVAYENKDYTGSHKYINDTMVSNLELTLKDEFYQTKTSSNPIDYEIEVKYVGDI